MNLKKLCGLVLVLCCLTAFVAPQRARALDTQETMIIVSASAGTALTLVALVAVMMTDRDDPEFFNFQDTTRRQPRTPSGSPIRFGSRCAPADGAPVLACW